MNTNDMILVSVDDHVIEPPTMFDAHIPEKYRDQAPKVKEADDGSQYWEFEGGRAPNMGLNAVAGCPPEEYGLNPLRFDQMRPGCYDIHERIRDMNANGVLGSINFPTFVHFCGQLFLRATDKDLSLACVRAYNDWHIDEWAGSYPERIIPLSIMPLWDVELMAEEIRRTAAKGCHAVTFSENPEKLGLPGLHLDYWDPFLQACEDTGTVVCLHIGSSSSMTVTSMDAPVDVSIAITPMNSFLALNDLMWTPICRKFPNIMIAMSEGGTGWIPYALERMDYTYSHHRAWTGADFGGLTPTEIFHRNFSTCFIDDRAGILMRKEVGIDRMTWECDYPHSDSTWPHSADLLAHSLEGVPDDEIDKITHLNAMKIYQFDPFAIRPRDKCTVGALKAEGADVDTSLRSMGRGKGSPMTARQLAEIAGRMASK
ncbi:MAG: putative Amidohydrolase domain [Actinomycetota bacterium]|jgi:predicted TIM-barrel fold metal-dependent hydrolase